MRLRMGGEEVIGNLGSIVIILSPSFSVQEDFLDHLQFLLLPPSLFYT